LKKSLILAIISFMFMFACSDGNSGKSDVTNDKDSALSDRDVSTSTDEDSAPIPDRDASAKVDDDGETDSDQADSSSEQEADMDEAPVRDSDETGDETESDEDSPPLGEENISGRVEVISRGYLGNYNSASLTANFYDQPVRMDAFSPQYIDSHALTLEDGDCKIYRAEEFFCDPVCGHDERCGKGDQCEKMYNRIDAGKITVSAAGKSYEILPGDWGYVSKEFPLDSLKSDVTIKAEAPGNSFSQFSIETKGSDALVTSIKESNNIKLSDDKDTTVSWTPKGGGTIRLLLNFGWHQAPPDAIIVCEAEDSQGEIVIPKSIIKESPYTTGVGLEPHQSFIARISRKRETTNSGVIEFIAGFYQMLYPLHEE